MPVDRSCDARFGAVRDAFAENFASRGEVGAAACVVVDGRTVVDLWGGHANAGQTRAWTRDTLVNVFSIGKGLAAACVARLPLDVDAPVARYWPEFGAAGKGEVTVRQALSHQAGLPAVRERLPDGAMLDHDLMASALAAQEPWWEPGTAHGYHTNTFGFLVGELVRRVDGRTLGTLFREDIARPLDADVHIGLSATEDHRVADFLWPQQPMPELPAELTDRERMLFNTYWNPPGLSGAGVVNSREWRAAEIPSTNGHATARGIARVYASIEDVVEEGRLREATTEQVYGEDVILGRPSRFGLGFQLTQAERPLGPNPGAFGHFGAGGSLGFYDPQARVGFGYVMNQMGPRWQNPRNRALIEAVYASL